MALSSLSPRTRYAGLWPYAALFLLIGYFTLGRSFAYFGVARANIFIGEVVLALFLLLLPRSSFGAMISALSYRQLLTGYTFAFFTVAFLGLWQIVRGVLVGYSPMAALLNLVFNVYPIYFFLGVYLGKLQPDLAGRILRISAWAVGLYGIAYILILRDLGLVAFYADVPAFGQPYGAGVALLGLLCYERRLWPVAVPLLLNVIVLLGLQVRAEWLGFAAAIGLWSVLTGRVHKAIGVAIAAVLILAAIEVSGIQIAGRTAQLTLSETVGRLVAPISPQLAAEFTTRVESAAGTFEWRVLWWEAIWKSVTQDFYHLLFGNGYGFRLQSLVSYLRTFPDEIRTPHNFVLYALGYGGFTMLIAYLFLLGTMAKLGWRYFLVDKQPFPLCFLVITIMNALASNFFEAPFGAIPFFLLSGIALGPLFRREQLELAAMVRRESQLRSPAAS